MKTVVLIVGLVALVLGLHWVGQGTGVFVWPSNPAMDNNPTFIYIGAGTVLAALVLMVWSRR
jgi:Zn-dependent protease with chaperone function